MLRSEPDTDVGWKLTARQAPLPSDFGLAPSPRGSVVPGGGHVCFVCCPRAPPAAYRKQETTSPLSRLKPRSPLAAKRNY